MFIAVLALNFAGCGPRQRPPEQICKGKTLVQESLAALQARAANITAIKASGQAKYTYRVNGRTHDESLTLLLRFEPANQIYVQGDATLIPRAVMLGANDQEFWLALRPKEISRYYWGQWGGDSNEAADIHRCLEQFWLGPQVWLDALGIIRDNPQNEWSLSHSRGYDVLEMRRQGLLVKRISIYNCEYEVRKIEYFNTLGHVAVVMELNEYTAVSGSNGWMVPTKIDIAQVNGSETLKITLKNSATATFTPQQKAVLFTRPQPKGFEFIGKLNSNCEFAPQD